MQDVDDAGPVIDIGNEPATVMANIKDYARSDAVGIVQSLPDAGEVVPLCRLYDPIPPSQRSVPLGAQLASLPDFSAAYDAHAKSSHIAKIMPITFWDKTKRAQGVWAAFSREPRVAARRIQDWNKRAD